MGSYDTPLFKLTTANSFNIITNNDNVSKNVENNQNTQSNNRTNSVQTTGNNSETITIKQESIESSHIFSSESLLAWPSMSSLLMGNNDVENTIQNESTGKTFNMTFEFRFNSFL